MLLNLKAANWRPLLRSEIFFLGIFKLNKSLDCGAGKRLHNVQGQIAKVFANASTPDFS
jgi:hypothetical protein